MTEPYPKYILRNIIISGTSVDGGGNLPSGGTTGQYLRKISSTDFDTQWSTLITSHITDLTATATEINYTDGVTSSIQTQLDAKLGTSLTSANIIVGNGSNIATAVAMTGDIAITNGGVTSIGSGVIVNADVNASAAIAVTKLAALTASRATVTDGSGFLASATTTATEIGYVNGVTSAIQTQLNAKLTSSLTSANVFVGNGSNIATGVAVTGDISINNTGVTAIASGVIVNADVNASAAIALSKLATVTASRALVSTAGGVISPASVTATELGHLSGVTAAIQTQLDDEIATQSVNAIVKSPTSGEDGYAITWDDLAGEYTLTDPIIQGLTAGGTAGEFLVKLSGTNYDADWRLPVLTDVSDVTASASEVNILDGATLTVTELNYVDGVTSAIQTQLDAKLNSSLAQNAMWVGNVSGIASQLSPGTSGYILTSVGGAPQWQPPTAATHVIENAGTPLTARANLNFTNGLKAADNSPDTDAKLGGVLTENTSFTGNFTFEIGTSGSRINDISLYSNDDININATDALSLVAGGTLVVQGAEIGLLPTTSTVVFNSASPPGSGSADVSKVYCKDVSSSSELFVMNEASVETKLSGNRGNAGGTLVVDTTTVGNTTSGEDDLKTYTIPANFLKTNGQSIVSSCTGSLAANANNKVIKVYFGSTLIFNTGSLIASGVQWNIQTEVIRTGASAQKCVVVFTYNGLTSAFVTYSTAAEDTTSTISFRVTGESLASATNDIVSEMFKVKWEAESI